MVARQFPRIKKGMYIKRIRLVNSGPIESIELDLPFLEDGKPKPLVLVGANGSGKSILLSHVLNALISAHQVCFEDSEVERGKVYKLRSPQYIRSGASYSFSRVDFGSDLHCIEWQLACRKEEFPQEDERSAIDASFDNIDPHDTSHYQTNLNERLVELRRQFSENCVLYFPPNRFEHPAWLNVFNLKTGAEFAERKNILGISNRRVIQESPLATTRNWLLDVLIDRLNYDIKFGNYPVPIPNSAAQQAHILPLFLGYQGRSASIWDAITKVITTIFGDDESIRIGIGPRHNRSVSIFKNEAVLIPNIFQLSTGQTSILNIVLSILHDFDMSGANLSSIEDVRGTVVIDEVDLHLHADLQCRLLPSIIQLFPNVQFILTTHSPLFLLGMKEAFGADRFQILALPNGNQIVAEEFEEFTSAFNTYRKSETFIAQIESEIKNAQKPVIFVEGDYDIKYLVKAAEFLGELSVLESISLHDGEGFGNLDNIWKACSSRINPALPRLVGLIYDCDTQKCNSDKNMAKKRVIPTNSDGIITKGIENLIPSCTINRLRESHPQFFDVAPARTVLIRGVPSDEPERCNVNRDEKRNLCDWLCAHGSAEDFKGFQRVFDLIKSITGWDQQQAEATD